MPQARKERLHGLDLLRAAAILLVLLFHYRVYYGVPLSLKETGLFELSGFGWSGVELFFVLSGYLIGDKLLGDFDRSGRIRFTNFYANRAFRILPAYLVTLVIYFSIEQVQEGRGLQPLWTFLTFTQNLLIDRSATTFSHAWSLCVEEHFYLLLPLFLYFLFAWKAQGKALHIIVGVIAAGLFFRYLSWVELVDPAVGRARIDATLVHIYYPTYTRLDGLVVGVAIAALFRYRPALRDRLTSHGNTLLVLGILVVIAALQLFGGPAYWKLSELPVALFGFPLLAIGYGIVVIAALSPSCFLYRLRLRPIAALAAYAYAIYLTHKMTNHWINTNLEDIVALSKTQTFLFCLLAAVAAGATLHYLVEKPFLTARDRLQKKWPEANALR